ncbi:hypothetical protein IFM89_028668 [Coptis chinensis]|uniref:Uncharacterized protein n=1 Tax=Coptis chinensis TaxID=261450 RepID=A0A835GZT2_9MAGN|nr:hypothetical protein IFM89_028668 [Coptis chinensis]
MSCVSWHCFVHEGVNVFSPVAGGPQRKELQSDRDEADNPWQNLQRRMLQIQQAR